MKHKLQLDTVCLIMALKSNFGNADTLMQALRNYWWGYNAGFEYGSPDDYKEETLILVLRDSFEELLNVSDRPGVLYHQFADRLKTYDFNKNLFGDLCELDEPNISAETYALLRVLYNLQIRNRKTYYEGWRCINGFTNKLIKQADKQLKDWKKQFDIAKDKIEKEK